MPFGFLIGLLTAALHRLRFSDFLKPDNYVCLGADSHQVQIAFLSNVLNVLLADDRADICILGNADEPILGGRGTTRKPNRFALLNPFGIRVTRLISASAL
jgi:hypothetical protein